LIRSFEPVKEESRLVSNPYFNVLVNNVEKKNETKIYPNLVPKQSLISPSKEELPKTNKELLKQWKKKALKVPDEEFEINRDFVPEFLTIYRNYLFCMDNSGDIIVFVITSNKKIEYKNTFKIDVPKIRSISTNHKYFGLTYSKLESKEMKRMLKNVKPSGVLLFKKDNDMISTIFEKELHLNNSMKSPSGLALNDEFAFVCDRELKCVFKINIDNGQLINKIDLMSDNGEPYECSINKNYLIITDIYNHKLRLYDILTLKNINNLIVKQDDGMNGPFDIYLTENNLVIYKNYKDYQLVLTDTDFDEQIYFEKLKHKFFDFSIFQEQNSLFVVVGAFKEHFKLITYID
jgi:hypothetical protein